MIKISFTSNKPTIEDIEISQEELEELNSKLRSSSSAWGKNKNHIVRKYIGGTCCICAEIPTKKVSYDLEGYGKRVEWYCDKCFTRWEQDKDKVVLTAINGDQAIAVRNETKSIKRVSKNV